MADWTTIPNSSLEPGSPARSIDALALRDNPIAITEGATGAPRVSDAGLSTTVTSTGQAWVSNRLTTNAVLSATAAAAAGAVGTYAFLRRYTNIGYTNPGTILAGSSLGWNNGSGVGTSAGIDIIKPPGTWMLMGLADGSTSSTSTGTAASLWLRIA